MTINIIDGNAFFHAIADTHIKAKIKTVHSRPFFQAGDDWVIKSECAEYYSKSLTTFLYNNTYPIKDIVDHIVIVTDGKSWRSGFRQKNIKLLENRADYNLFPNKEGYKGTRDKSSDDAIQISSLISHFISNEMPRLSSVTGISHLHSPEAEGDDCIALLMEAYPDANIIVWANDGDLTQLLTPTSVMIGNKNNSTGVKKMIRSTYFKDASRVKLNLGFASSKKSFNATITGLVDSGDFGSDKVEPAKEAFIKILIGDMKSDNIPPIMYKLSDKNKVISFSNKRFAEKVYDKMVEKYGVENILPLLDRFNKEFIEDIVTESILVFDPPKELIPNIKTNIQVNIKMIRLSSAMMPKHIVDDVREKIGKIVFGDKFDIYSLKNI